MTVSLSGCKIYWGQAPNGQQQQSSGWDAPGQIHFYPSLPSQPPAASSPFGSSMDSNTGRGVSSSNGSGVPVTQQDLFYQPINSMDMMSDFSFMNRRPTASCSQLIRPVSYYPHTPTSSDAAAAESALDTARHTTAEKPERYYFPDRNRLQHRVHLLCVHH